MIKTVILKIYLSQKLYNEFVQRGRLHCRLVIRRYNSWLSLLYYLCRSDTWYVNYHRPLYLASRVHSIRLCIIPRPPGTAELYVLVVSGTNLSRAVRRYLGLYLIHTCVAGTRASSRNLTGAVLLAARFAWEHARPEIGYLITRCLVALLPCPHSSSRLASRACPPCLSHARKWSRISDFWMPYPSWIERFSATMISPSF